MAFDERGALRRKDGGIDGRSMPKPRPNDDESVEIDKPNGTRPRMTRAEKANQRRAAYEMSVRKMDPYEIAKELNCSVSTVRNHIIAVEHDMLAPVAFEECNADLALIKQLMAEAIAKYRQTHEPADYEPIDKMLTRKSKMIGYDKPTQTQTTVLSITPEDIELNELMNEQRAKNAAIDMELRGITMDGEVVESDDEG